MVKVRNEDWLDDDQKEALRMVNQHKVVKAVYDNSIHRGWDEHAALRDVYDWLFYGGAEEKGITDFRP